MESFLVYIDEAGDEGFSFDKGSSEWFLVSSVINDREEDIKNDKVVDYCKDRFGWKKGEDGSRKPLHFKDLNHDQKSFLISEITKVNIHRVITICIHKPTSLTSTLPEESRLYFYTCRLLFERISWYCRDIHKQRRDSGDGSARIIFSIRSETSYKDLKKYLVLLKTKEGIKDKVKIEWSVIREDNIDARHPREFGGLKIVDAVVGGFYRGLNLSPLGFIEERFATFLKPTVYNYRGKYLNYGLKFLPERPKIFSGRGTLYGWIGREYQ